MTWMVAYKKPQKEMLAQKNLAQQNFLVYCSILKKRN